MIADRYRKIAKRFTEIVDNTPDDAWDNPAPCEGWTARDVVGHLTEWLPSFFFEQWGLVAPDHSWHAISDTIQDALDDPAKAKTVRTTRMGDMTFEDCIDMICTPDVLVHTWDLARATGQDETLDPDEVHRLFAQMEPYDEMLRTSGQYGPRVPVPDDADEQTKLIAFTGRTP